MSDQAKCPECGAVLPPDGRCVNCLLSLGQVPKVEPDPSAKAVPETPPANAPTLGPQGTVPVDACTDAVRTLAEQVLSAAKPVPADVISNIEALIAQIHKKLSEQINLILHHEAFKGLEGTWRGLHYLVNNIETDEMLKIRVLNISKQEPRRALKKFEGTAWDQCSVFKRVYDDGVGSPKGQPYGCLVGDYYFDHSPEDVNMLGKIAKIAATSHAPFIAAADPSVLDMDSWQELNHPGALTKLAHTA